MLKAILTARGPNPHASGKVVTFNDLVDQAFDGNDDLEFHTISKTVNDLRQDLGANDCIQSEYGIGYYFELRCPKC